VQSLEKELTMDVQLLGQKLGLKLPMSTEILGVETEAGIDDAVRAKLRIPTAQAQTFLQDCGVSRFKKGGANLMGPDHGFWDPHAAKTLRSGEVSLTSGRAVIVAVDESSEEHIVVYVMNYST
jgi:hypothetical protein